MAKTSTITASLAGVCYPAEAPALLDYFQEALKQAPKPSSTSRQAPGYIVPHIDFRVNLEIYAQVYRMVAERGRFPELFLIMGVGHRCPHEFSLCPFTFETPLGQVETGIDTLRLIQKKCAFPLSLSPATFHREHSLEFVIVWLQALRDLYFPGKNFKVLPLLMGGLHQALAENQMPGPESDFYQFGKILKETLDKEDALVIASIDGCHVGPRFDHDFEGNAKVQKIVTQWEDELWSFCRSDQLDAFFQHAVRIQNGFYFDGLGVLGLLLQHYHLKATRSSQDLWYEKSDQSFVTFSGGWFDNTCLPGTQL